MRAIKRRQPNGLDHTSGTHVPFILLLILAWPFLEIATFIYVGSRIGILPTIALTLLSSFVGVLLLRIQGIALLQKMRTELAANRVPAADIGHGAFIAFAGLCLLIPGFLTDILGLLLFLPPVRAFILYLLSRNATIVVRTSTTRSGVVDLDPADWHEGGTGTGAQSPDPKDEPRSLPKPPHTP